MVPPQDQIARHAYEIWQSQGMKLGHDQEYWLAAETHLNLIMNYELYRFFWLNGNEGKRIHFGKRNLRTCRFCSRPQADVNFEQVAHAVPYFLGNRHLISEDECDDCNKYFSETLEDHLAKLLKPILSMEKIKGRNGMPKYKSRTGASWTVTVSTIALMSQEL
jgi:hypothetical protein